jgi:hypothetical protein
MNPFARAGIVIIGSTVLAGAAGCRSTRVRDEALRATLDAWMRDELRSNSAHEILQRIAVARRISGSAAAADAVERAKQWMTSLHFENVRLEPVTVPAWSRRMDAATIVSGAPKMESLRVAAFGGSPPTPSDGVEGEIVEINSWDELKAAGDRVRGKILFFNRAMDPRDPDPFHAYGQAVDQRSRCGYEAKKAGAIAALVRSVTTRLDDEPHTGAMTAFMDDKTTPVAPAAAVSTLGARRLHSLLLSGATVRVRLQLVCGFGPDVQSANVVGEITGSEKPDEIVLVGGHLDAWDLASGAHDDAAGCAHAIEALRLILATNRRPKRTIRAVLFMNEENGLRGGRAYAEAHANEKHIFAIESDRGGFEPVGFRCNKKQPFYRQLEGIVSQLGPLRCARLDAGGGGADISPLQAAGVTCGELIVDAGHYFDFHHSATDVPEAVDPGELQRGAIALAFVLLAVADM